MDADMGTAGTINTHRHRRGYLSESGCNTIYTGVAASDHYDSLVLCWQTDVIDIRPSWMLLLPCLEVVDCKVDSFAVTTCMHRHIHTQIHTLIVTEPSVQPAWTHDTSADITHSGYLLLVKFVLSFQVCYHISLSWHYTDVVSCYWHQSLCHCCLVYSQVALITFYLPLFTHILT